MFHGGYKKDMNDINPSDDEVSSSSNRLLHMKEFSFSADLIMAIFLYRSFSSTHGINWRKV